MIQEMIDQLADQAAFLWLLRDRAARAPHYDLAELCELDERLEAQLDGLRLAGEEGWERCRDALSEEDAGECFAAAVLAIEREDLRGLAGVLDAGGGSPEASRGIVGALGWVSFAQAVTVLEPLLDARCPPALRALGIAGSVAHARDPGNQLSYALFDADPALKARALRAVGELGRVDLLSDIRPDLAATDGRVRFWAAWSTALLGDAAAVPVLWEVVKGRGADAARACDLAVRRMDVAAARLRLQNLATYPEHARTAVAGAAALGDPAELPWLLECMDTPALARAAGEAFSSITGVTLTGALVAAAPPDHRALPTDDPEDEDVSEDPDEKVRWPAPAAVGAWYAQNRTRFQPGVRHLLGKPMDPGSLQRTLREARQPRRAAAALELSLRTPGRPLFDVGAPGFRQLSALEAG